MGRLAIGTRALGKSFGFEVKVLRDTPGPHNMKACSPDEGSVACGIFAGCFVITRSSSSAVIVRQSDDMRCSAIWLRSKTLWREKR